MKNFVVVTFAGKIPVFIESVNLEEAPHVTYTLDENRAHRVDFGTAVEWCTNARQATFVPFPVLSLSFLRA